MRKFFVALWRVVTFPFRLIYWIVVLPFRLYKRASAFLNTEPEEHPLTEVLTGVVTDGAVRQMMWDQIEALRKHLLRAVIGLFVGVAITFYFAQALLEILAQPIGGLDHIQALEITESVGVFMQVALLAGFAVALPYIAYELWLFAAPGLKPRERKMGLASIPLATLLFICGLLFTYYILLPPALNFLQHFAGISMDRPQAKFYYGFVTNLMMWIGLSFEFPLVIYALTVIGLVKPQPLAKQWRLAVVIIAILAAAITPTVDIVDMALVMLPMIALYFVGIGLSYIAYAGRKKPVPEAGESVEQNQAQA